MAQVETGHSDDVHPTCCSWLEKQAEWRPAWDRRYVTLDGSRLEYRLSESAAPKKCGTVVSLEREVSGPLAFRVWLLEGGSWTFRATEQAVYDRWVRALQLSLQPRAVGSPPPSSPVSPEPASFLVTADPVSGETETDGADVLNRRPDGQLRNWSIPPQPADTSSNPSSHRARHRDPHTNGNLNEVLLTAVVEKQAAWTMKWNPRVIELREGCQLVYRAVNGDARQRYFIVGVDRSDEKNHDTHLLFSTSTGDSFWVSFHSVAECEQWFDTVRLEMKRSVPWHWFAVQSVGPSDSLNTTGGGLSSIFGRLMEKRSTTTAPLHVCYHCAAILPSSGSSGGTPGLLVFGGVTQWCGTTGVSANKRWRVPISPLSTLSNACVMLPLRGNFKPSALDVEPHAEEVNVKVRAPKLYGATLSLVTFPLEAADRNAGRGVPGASTGKSQLCAMVVGGIGGIPQLLPETEVWGVAFPSAGGVAASVLGNTGDLQWKKWVVPSSQLPPVAFHSAVSVHAPLFVEASSGSSDDMEKRRISRECVLVAGGVNHELQPVKDAFALSWHSKLVPGRVSEEVLVRRLPNLPQPRAFHGSAVLRNGTVVLVGGRNASKTVLDPLIVLRLPASSPARWESVEWSGSPLPSLQDATAAVTPSGQSIVVLAQVGVFSSSADPQCGVRLFLVHFETGGENDLITASWSEVSVRMGMVPKRVSGCTIHIHEGYVYVLGASHLRESLQPSLCGPLRVLMS